jgi:hypothetical protein
MMNADNITDFLMGRPFKVGDIGREIGLDAFIDAYDFRKTDDYWQSKHMPTLQRCYNALVERSQQEFAGIRSSKLRYITKNLLEVVNICAKPLKVRSIEDDARRYDVTLGEAWKTYLFDGYTPLWPDDKVRITVLEPDGQCIDELKPVLSPKAYKVEFTGSPFGLDYAADLSIELDKREIMTLWGAKDHQGNTIKPGSYARVLYKMERIPGPGGRMQPIAGDGLNYVSS